MSYLLQSWKDSLTLFKPKNFKLFAMATFKTIVQAYWLLLKYFWWLVALQAIFRLYALYAEVSFLVYLATKLVGFDYAEALVFYMWMVGIVLAWSIWVMVVVLSVRPSVQRKDFAYFIQYIQHVIPCALGSAMIVAGFLLPLALIATIQSYNLPFLGFYKVFNTGEYIVLLSILFLFLFFVLDMPASLKNIGRAILFALKMFWYNVPALFLMSSVAYALQLTVQFALIHLLRMIIGAEQVVAFLLLFLPGFTIPIVASFIGNFYTMRLHEQPQLFFKQPKE